MSEKSSQDEPVAKAAALEAESPGNSLDDDPKSLVGQLIADRYRVEKLLGVGGMGSVYRASHVQLRKTVALKALHPEMTRLPEAVARFEREAIAASRIEHKNVAVATDFGRLENGTFYLILEYVEGESLREKLHREKCLTPGLSLQIARQIADALQAAHAHGIVHRDLKPENVMLVSRPQGPIHVKVLDFGIAKVPLEGSPEGITAVGSVLGTPSYMSPEQCAGRVIDARSDLYSLGIIIYECVNGRKPYATDDALALLSRHLAVPPDPINSDVPPRVAEIISKLLEKDPQDRVQSAIELLGIIDAAALEDQNPRFAQNVGTFGLRVRSSLGSLRRKLVGLRLLSDWSKPRLHLGYSWLKRHAGLRIRVKQMQLPLGIVELLAVLLVITCLSIVMRIWHMHGSVASPSNSAAATVARADSVLPRGSRAEFQRQVERIEMLKVYERSERDWTLLARGYAELGQWQKCAQAYRSVLCSIPASDPTHYCSVTCSWPRKIPRLSRLC